MIYVYMVCVHMYVHCVCIVCVCIYDLVHVHVCMCALVYLWHVCMHINLWCAHVWGHMPAYGGQRTHWLRQAIFVICQCIYSAKIAGSQASRERSFHRNTGITELQYAQFCVGPGDSDSGLHDCSTRTVPTELSPQSLFFLLQFTSCKFCLLICQ